MKRVRLIRHAQSAANAGLITTDPESIPLTDTGRRQAQALADSLISAPDLIISSPFVRAKDTALPTALRFPGVPVEWWPVEEFTYLSPGRFAGSTQADRKPMADAYWQLANQSTSDGPGAESFEALLGRARDMLERLAACNAQHILVFSHGQFIRAVAWFIQHGERGGRPELMRRFRALEIETPLVNCAGYELTLREGAWVIEDQPGR